MTHPAAPSNLEDRYGTRRTRGVDRRLGITVAVVLLALGLIFLLLSGWHQQSVVDFRTVSYQVSSDDRVRVDYEVTAPSGSSVACVLEALSSSYASVGWVTVLLDPSDQHTRHFSQDIVTTSRATTGEVRTCWMQEPA